MNDATTLPTRHVWDFGNPSDPITLAGTDFEAVALAALVVGNGKANLQPKDGGPDEMPLFLFGGAQEWFEKRFGHTIKEGLEQKRLEVCDALDSFLIGSPSDRKLFESAVEKMPDSAARAAYLVEWQDSRRSSMNDFCSYAWRLAAKIRASTPEPTYQTSA